MTQCEHSASQGLVETRENSREYEKKYRRGKMKRAGEEDPSENDLLQDQTERAEIFSYIAV